nr:hypothetical protein [Tanacetum cinerariifolium]
MALTLADTHNMIAYLTKSNASKGFDQIIDFLNASSIKYALTVNPNIYVLCIKQFWTSVLVKKVNDVTRLHALVDKKRVIITKDTIRDALRLVDAEGIDYLPNEEIFAELSRIGYEKPFTKFTFYKAFFSPQWKFLIHTILQCMSAKRTSWNEFSSSMASAVICLSTGKKFNFSKAQVGDLSSHSTKYSYLAITQKVFANMRRVDKGFSEVDRPLFEGMIVAQDVDESAAEVNVDDVPAAGVADEGAANVNFDVVLAAVDEPSIPSPTPPTQPPPPLQDQPSTSQVQHTLPQSSQAQLSSPQQQPQPLQDAEFSTDLFHNLLDICTTLTRRVENLEQNKIALALEITKVETSDDTIVDDVSKQGRIIADMDVDVDVTLKDIAKDVAVDDEIKESTNDDEVEPAELQEVVEMVTIAKLITEVVTAASATIIAAAPQLTTAAAPTLTTAPSAAIGRKGVVIRDPKETATQSTIIHSEAKSKDKGKGILDDADKVLSMQDDKVDLFKLQEVVEVVTTAKLITEVVTAASAIITAAALQLTFAIAPTLTTAPSATRRRKRVVIRDPEETATPSTIIHFEAKSKDKGKGILVEEPKPLKKQDQIEQDEAYVRELEAELNKNIYWDEKTKEQMKEEDSRALKRLSESQEDQAAKKQKLDEEVEELRKHLQIVPNDDDDVYTEATPLALKDPVVDYEINIQRTTKKS